MNKLLNRLLELFRGNKKATPIPQPRPKVKRQNAVPTLKNTENKVYKERPKKHSADNIVGEAKKKKNEPVQASDIEKSKKKKYYRYKNFKNKKSTPPQGKEGSKGK
jgi:hypothetical protein